MSPVSGTDLPATLTQFLALQAALMLQQSKSVQLSGSLAGGRRQRYRWRLPRSLSSDK